MGFNFHNLGNIHECWIENNLVFYRQTSTGKVYSYHTALNVTLPAQTNLFASNTVAFLLYDDEKEYIGRYDGVISIYRRSDDMLVGLSNWKPPEPPSLKLCGFYDSPFGPDEIKLDMRDQQTVYINYKVIEARLKEPLTLKLDKDMSLLSTRACPEEGPWHIYNERGESVAVDDWFIQDEVWRRDCTVFL